MESQETPDNPNNPELNEQCWRDYHSRAQDTLQNHCKKKKKYGAGTKTDMSTNRTKPRTQT